MNKIQSNANRLFRLLCLNDRRLKRKIKKILIKACAKFFEKHNKAVLAKGKSEGIAKNIIRILTRRFDKSPSMRLQRQIMSVKDIDKLDELCDFAFDCVSLGEFATAFN
ncbi:MAG: DUF4351 domain-containing protein [Planctomycetaceae bacterium]|jgi:hypothetical protein|nr:DUF4351 domain-containing protein [Planctomycetaceae bacterium]